MSADPYAAIRRLPFRYSHAERDLATNRVTYYWEMGSALMSPEERPFQSKYNAIDVIEDDPSMLFVTLQQPGAHKYDTMVAAYKLDPGTVQRGQTVMGTLVNDPAAFPTRQTSSARENWQMVATAAAVILAVYGAGAYLGSVAAGGSGAAAAGGAAGGAGGGAGAGGAVGSSAGSSIGAGASVTVPGAGSGFTLSQAVNYLRLGSQVYAGLARIDAFLQSRNPTLDPGTPDGPVARDDGYLYAPDGTRSMPEVGTAYVTSTGNVIVNQGDGTYAIVNRATGDVRFVRYAESDAGAGSGFDPGAIVAPVVDFFGRLSTGEKIGLASLAMMILRR